MTLEVVDPYAPRADSLDAKEETTYDFYPDRRHLDSGFMRSGLFGLGFTMNCTMTYAIRRLKRFSINARIRNRTSVCAFSRKNRGWQRRIH